MKNKLTVLIIVVLGVVGFLLVFFTYPRSPYANGALDGFARCLASKGAQMYGAYWCPHCQSQKAEFGDSFKYVNYVECTKEIAKCTAAGIQGYPTWIFPASSAGGRDGTRLEGEQTFEKLSSASQCPLPTQSSSTQNSVPLPGQSSPVQSSSTQN